MLDKSKRYIITIPTKQDERDLISFFHDNEIYWVSKTHTVFHNKTLEQKLQYLNIMGHKYPQLLELTYDSTDFNYWVYYYISSKTSYDIAITSSQLLRKVKLEKLNSLCQ